MTRFDELNKLFKGYFDVMGISETDKKKRIDCAFFFYDAVWYTLTLIRLEYQQNRLEDIASYIQTLVYRLSDALQDIPYDEAYLKDVSTEIVETTFRHLEDTDEDEENYYTSEKRAILIAQNEANTVMNRNDFEDAKNSGKTTKTWITEGDEKVREAHVLVDMVSIPIDQTFQVGKDNMMYPHDYENGSAENLVNCRCWCEYR